MSRAQTSQKVGRGLCPECGEPVTYRKSSGGMLTHKCDACDSSGYAEPGGASFAKRMATIADPAPAPAPASKPAGPTLPQSSGAFHFGKL